MKNMEYFVCHVTRTLQIYYEELWVLRVHQVADDPLKHFHHLQIISQFYTLNNRSSVAN